MTGDYAAQIEQASTLLADAILAEERLESEALETDAGVQVLLRQIGQQVMHRVLNVRARQVTREAQEGNGLPVERCPAVTVLSVFGPVDVPSPYLWAPGRGAGVRPVQRQLGLTHRRRSLAVERALTDFGAEESFGLAAKRFAEHYGWAVDRTTILRVVEQHASQVEKYIGDRLAEGREAFTEPLGVRPGAERLLTELDGCEIRTGTLVPHPEGGTTPVRQNERRQRLEEWRDVRIGFVRGLEEVDRTYVGAMASYQVVVGQLFDAAVARGLSSRTEMVAVADGGNGLREELAAQFAKLRFIYDRPHLKQHLYETAEAIGLKEVPRHRWVDAHMERLETGHSDQVLAAFARHKGRGKKRVTQMHNHLKRFADAVHYEAFRAQGLPTGSGEIESAHRYIPQKRLKLPGASWLPKNINPMLSLRLLRANDWWGTYWDDCRSRATA